MRQKDAKKGFYYYLGHDYGTPIMQNIYTMEVVKFSSSYMTPYMFYVLPKIMLNDGWYQRNDFVCIKIFKCKDYSDSFKVFIGSDGIVYEFDGMPRGGQDKPLFIIRKLSETMIDTMKIKETLCQSKN